MKTYLIPIAAVLILFSCELVIDVETPDFDPSIVANSIIQPDSSFRVYLSRDYYILDNQIDNYEKQGLTGATIRLFENDQLLGTMNEIVIETQWGETFNGYYVFDYQPKAGQTYRMEVEKSGYETVIAEQQIPQGLPDVTVAITDTTESEWGSELYKVEMDLKDLPGDNYYEVQLYISTWEPNYDYEKDSTWYRQVIYELYAYPESILVSEYQERFLFSDELFKDTDYTITFEIENYFNYYYDDGISEPPGDSYIFYQVRNCTEAYYNYYNSAALYSWNDGNPFAEPVHVYTNIENGFGIFGSFTSRTDTLLVY